MLQCRMMRGGKSALFLVLFGAALFYSVLSSFLGHLLSPAHTSVVALKKKRTAGLWGGVVNKTQYSATTRFLFIASLGGTGHHGWQTVLNECKVCSRNVRVEAALTDLWWGKDIDADVHAERVKETLAAAAAAADEGANNHGLVCLNALARKTMFSYPKGNSPRHHPNVYTLVMLAEEAGIDLRILVLHRHPAPQLVSLSIHRHVLSLPEEAHQMTNQGALLNSQLALIDPKFYVCAGFSSVLDSRSIIQDHVFGRMIGKDLLLSHALEDNYRAGTDNPDAAWVEIKKYDDGKNIEIKVHEMEMYYRYLIEVLCTR